MSYEYIKIVIVQLLHQLAVPSDYLVSKQPLWLKNSSRQDPMSLATHRSQVQVQYILLSTFRYMLFSLNTGPTNAR